MTDDTAKKQRRADLLRLAATVGQGDDEWISFEEIMLLIQT